MSGPIIPIRQWRSRWLGVLRLAWFLIVPLNLGLFIMAIPAHYDQLTTLSGAALPAGWTQSALRAALGDLGLSIDFYAAYLTALRAIFGVITSAIALLIFWRRSQEPGALIISLWLVTFSTTGITVALADTVPVVSGVVQFLDELGWVFLLPVVFFTFPDGRFIPPWTRWLALAWMALGLLASLLAAGADTPTPLPIVLIWISIWVVGLLAQIHRFTRVSNPVQRQQTKWVLFGLAGSVLTLLVILSLVLAFPELEQPTPWGLLYGHLGVELAIALGFLLIPLSIAFSILRYRLWDFDLIIRRTTVYAALTGALALSFYACVLLVQFVLWAISGAEIGSPQPPALIISTLGTAALFNPLRRRVQDFIDRRFYRRKYDAERTLAGFATAARDETDLDQLTARLVEVVRETMQPAHVSLWLRPPADPGRPLALGARLEATPEER